MQFKIQKTRKALINITSLIDVLFLLLILGELNVIASAKGILIMTET